MEIRVKKFIIINFLEFIEVAFNHFKMCNFFSTDLKRARSL